MWKEFADVRPTTVSPGVSGTPLPAGQRANGSFPSAPLNADPNGVAEIPATPLPLAQSTPPVRFSHAMLGGVVALGDTAVLVLAAVLWAAVALETAWVPALAGFGLLFVSFAAGQYGQHGTTPAPTNLGLAWSMGTAVTVALLALIDATAADWSGFASWAALSAAGLVAWRVWLSARAAAWRAAGELTTRVAVVGDTEAEALLAAIAHAGADCGVALSGRHSVQTISNEASLQMLRQDAALGRIDAVIVALPWSKPDLVAQGCAALRWLPVDVWLLPDPQSPACIAARASLLPSVPLLPVALRPLGAWRGVAKRIEDLVLGTLLLMAFAPLMLLAAMAVAVDSRGPVLLRQRRFGFGNAPFPVYKFRTMYHDKGDVSGMRATVPGDPRVTRVGRVLRSTSLDELPQLLNVLKGDMSLVGPRPHPVEMRVLGHHYHDVVPRYPERHRMKPGITGLAQINGYRGLVDSVEKAQGRVAWDLSYVENWSVGMDIRILWRTVFRGFFGSGAF